MKQFFAGALCAVFLAVGPQASAEESHGSAHGSSHGEGARISGFVEVAYHQVPNHDESSFLLEQAELDIEKTFEGVGGLRLDLNHIHGDSGTADEIMEQGFVYVDFEPVRFTMGKFNAPIGWEAVDPNKLYQFSHSMVFDYGKPTNLTGLMLSGAAGMVDYAVYAVNGWDINGDDNTDKTLGGRLGVTPSEGINIGVSYITGKENATVVAESGSSHLTESSSEKRNLSALDIDMTLKLMHDHLLIGAEYNMGTYEGMSAVHHGDDATWSGYLVTVHYLFENHFGITLRYDSFHDKDGAILGNGVDETRDSFTIAPLYHLSHGAEILAEYRVTNSNHDTFHDKDGHAKSDETSFALKMVFDF